MSNENKFNSWLVIFFGYGKEDIADLHKYQSELENIIDPTGLGVVDGNEIAVDLSSGEYWVACKDPAQVFGLIKDSLISTELVQLKEVKKKRF